MYETEDFVLVSVITARTSRQPKPHDKTKLQRLTFYPYRWRCIYLPVAWRMMTPSTRNFCHVLLYCVITCKLRDAWCKLHDATTFERKFILRKSRSSLFYRFDVTHCGVLPWRPMYKIWWWLFRKFTPSWKEFSAQNWSTADGASSKRKNTLSWRRRYLIMIRKGVFWTQKRFGEHRLL